MKLETSLTFFNVHQLQLLYWLVLGTEANEAQFTLLTQFKCENVPVCAISHPNKSISVVSKGQCVLYCQNQRQKPETCIGVNFREQDNTCDVFYYEDIKFMKNVTGCQFIQKGSVDNLNCSKMTPPRDCADIRAFDFTTNGVYTVYVGNNNRQLNVYCDLTTTSGGWTVFQRRQDGSVDFYLTWASYQTGFGNISGEFWIGNENLNQITSAKRYKLRVDFTAFDGSTAYAEYDNFKVESAADKYKLSSLGTFSGTAGDSLSPHVGSKFSAYDQDNDVWSDNCAVVFTGAWWFYNCHDCGLNGKYYSTLTNNANGVGWYKWKSSWNSLKQSEMKITPFV